ncbi:MAG: DUF3368 domain-containing protein [Acidobacteriota bacterium]|nr:DUF3368 domain-containing protein [Acidobacteriota bacterium]
MIVSNTTPLNYLILIECVEVLPALYGEVLIPEAVLLELQHGGTQQVVREWMASSPVWLKLQQVTQIIPASLQRLRIGEAQAIALAEQVNIPNLILDDRAAREEAVRRGLIVVGTLRVLYAAAEVGLCNLPIAFDRLRQTSFRATRSLFSYFLEQDAERKQERP